MKTVSRSRIAHFMTTLSEQITSMDGSARQQSSSIISQVPVTHADIQSASYTDDDDFLDVLAQKFVQRYEDTGLTLSQAVDSGVETIDQLCDYLGIDHDAPVEEIVYRAHAHQRLSGKGRPDPSAILD